MIDVPTRAPSISARNGKPIRSKVLVYNGERYLRTPGRKYYIRENGTKTLHRQMWMDINGPIPDGHHIHHKDFNPDNNAMENLEMVRYDIHEAMHRKHEAEIRTAGLATCVQCGEVFEALRPSAAMYCSRRCERIHLKEGRVCEWCGSPFWASTWKKTKCCCKSHGQHLRNANEAKRLLALAGGTPLPATEVVKQ